MDRKKRIDQLALDLVRSNSHDAISVRELLGLLLEDAKDGLIVSSGDDTLRLQGQAQTLVRLRRQVTTPPSKIKTEGTPQ